MCSLNHIFRDVVKKNQVSANLYFSNVILMSSTIEINYFLKTHMSMLKYGRKCVIK